MVAGPSSFASSLVGRSWGTNGLVSKAVAFALKERLHVPSGEDTSNFFPAPSNDRRGFVPSRIFSTSSMTLERLSLSTMVAASGALVLRRDRAKSPRETAPSCANAQRGSISPTKANATQKQPLYLMKIRPREPTLSLQILV